MPYRSYYRKRRATRGVSKKAVRNVVKRVLNYQAEEKYSNSTLASATAGSAAWNFTSAMNLAQGTTAATRIGARVRVKRIEYNITIEPTIGAETNGSRCRIMLYHNKAAGGAVPTATAVFDTDSINSLRNLLQAHKYKLGKEYIHCMTALTNAAGVSTSAGPPIMFRWIQRVNKVVEYSGNAGNVGDLLTDDYGICWVSDSAGCCAVTIYSKMVFCDD